MIDTRVSKYAAGDDRPTDRRGVVELPLPVTAAGASVLHVRLLRGPWLAYRTRAMAPDADRTLFCPRCKYNLRGLTTPRCPECGLTFPDEQWQSGLLREHIPTWLDRCDPWQPHQVLIRSLYELFRCGLRPGWVLTRLDLHGPLWSAGLMLVFGTLWLYFICTLLIAGASVLHTNGSPYAALRFAAFTWTPRVLALILPVSGLTAVCATFVPAVCWGRTRGRPMLRLVGYWVPTACAPVLLLVPVLVALPPITPALFGTLVPVCGLPGLIAVLRSFGKGGRVPRSRGLAVALWCYATWIVLFAVAKLASQVVPGTLEPPP